MIRFTVRASTYRGATGWVVKGQRCDAFFEHEGAARRVAALMRANPDYEITLADFDEVS